MFCDLNGKKLWFGLGTMMVGTSMNWLLFDGCVVHVCKPAHVTNALSDYWYCEWKGNGKWDDVVE